MKFAVSIILIILAIASVIISGCTTINNTSATDKPVQSARPDNASRQSRNFNRSNNMTDEERQKQFEEMQKAMTEACQNKNENDTCQLTSSRGTRDGKCSLRNDTLICTIERPQGSAPPEMPQQ